MIYTAVSTRLMLVACHSLTVRSFEAEASSWPSGEKATALTKSERPSRVCTVESQALWTSGKRQIHRGNWSKNCSRTILVFGAKTSAAEYSWRGASSIIDLL